MPDLTRVTINLRSRASRAVERQAERSGLTQTDVINRAVILLDLLAAFEDDEALLVRDPRSGETQRIYLL